jgi:hypothetical protein
MTGQCERYRKLPLGAASNAILTNILISVNMMSLEGHTFAKFPFMKEWAFKVISTQSHAFAIHGMCVT